MRGREPLTPRRVVDEGMRVSRLPPGERLGALEDAATGIRIRRQPAVHVDGHFDVGELALEPFDAGEELCASLDTVALARTAEDERLVRPGCRRRHVNSNEAEPGVWPGSLWTFSKVLPARIPSPS